MFTKPRPRFIFTFLRHGESVGNAESRLQGQKDYPLNDTGRAQARALAQRWQEEQVHFDKIFGSPLARARETAEIISAALNVPVEFDPIWMERAGGELQGLTAAEMRELPKPDYTNPYVDIGGSGEGDWELFLRAGQALHSLLRQPIGRYLIVSHGGLLNQVVHAAVGITPHANSAGPRFRFENTGFARLVYFPSLHRWELDCLNDHNHWKTDPSAQE
jgi:broad specificity phosphatase PhoE